MRTLAITQNITLDGRIEMLGDWFDDQAQADGEGGLLAENRRQREAADALLVGRRTFVDLRGYWRDLADDATGVSDYLNGVSKHVVSATLGEPDWAGTSVHAVATGDDLVARVRALKEEPGRDIVCTGSITLVHALVAADLVDEYRLFCYPVVQGRGRSLFPEGHEQRDLRLAHSATYGNGAGFQRWVRTTPA